MKPLLMAMAIMMATMAFGAVVRTNTEDTITYTTDMMTTSQKGFWAVYQPVPTGCILHSAVCDVQNAACQYAYKSNDTRSIRVAANTGETGGNLPSVVTVTVAGSGTCNLGSFDYVESCFDCTPALGAKTTVEGDSQLIMNASCRTLADTLPLGNCSSVVDDEELLKYADSWLDNDVTDENLLEAALAWIQRI